jgi:hypothetical protein
MHRARAFFLVCAGIFLLALAYHLGARSAGAQAPENPVVGAFGVAPAVVTANGDVYELNNNYVGTWHRAGNVFSGNPTPAQSISINQLKAKYATPAPTKQP